MSGRTNVCQANVRRARDHLGTVQSGYCPIGLLSCRGTSIRATIPWANVRSGYCPVGLVSVEDLSLGKCPSGYCPVGTLPGKPGVTGNANVLQNVQHQEATSSQKMTNLHALWLKMPKYTLVNF